MTAETNPYRQLSSILFELWALASTARHKGEPQREKINAVTERWNAAELAARRNSMQRGIPFVEFDTALRQANEDLQELTQVAGGNTSVPFHPLDRRFTTATRRLDELAMVFDGPAGEPPPESEGWGMITPNWSGPTRGRSVRASAWSARSHGAPRCPAFRH